MAPKTLVHVAYKRMLVGYRKGDWKPVYYGQPNNMPYIPDARMKVGSPPGLCLYHTVRARDDDIKNPTEGEVAWLPHFHPENFEPNTAIERKRLQHWFIYHCWQYSTGISSANVKNNQFDRPDVPRWHTWREIADGVKRKKGVKKFVPDGRGGFQPYKDDDDDDDDSGYGSVPPSDIPPMMSGARGDSVLSQDDEHARRSEQYPDESDDDQDTGGRDDGHIQNFNSQNKRRRRNSDETIRPGDGRDVDDEYNSRLSGDRVNQLNGDMDELEALEYARQQSMSRQSSVAAMRPGVSLEQEQIRIAKYLSRLTQGNPDDDDDSQLSDEMLELLARYESQMGAAFSLRRSSDPITVGDEDDGVESRDGDTNRDDEGAMGVSNDADDATGGVPDAD